MGDAADDAYDCEVGYIEDYEYDGKRDSDHNLRGRAKANMNFQKNTGDYNWKIATGEIISMSSMDDAHINNAIEICIQYGNTGKLVQLRKTLNNRHNKPYKKKKKEDLDYIDFLKRVGEL